MCLHVGAKFRTTYGEMFRVDFPGKYVLPLPYEYVLGERDVASARPRNAIPINIFVVLNYKVWSFHLPANKMIYHVIIICLLDVGPIQLYTAHYIILPKMAFKLN